MEKIVHFLKKLNFGLFKIIFQTKNHMQLNLPQVLKCTEEGMCVGGEGGTFDKIYHPLNFMFDFQLQKTSFLKLNKLSKQKERERERVITVKKTTYLENIFDSRLYQFIVFIFLLKPIHKILFTIFTVKFKQKVKILCEKNLQC